MSLKQQLLFNKYLVEYLKGKNGDKKKLVIDARKNFLIFKTNINE